MPWWPESWILVFASAFGCAVVTLAGIYFAVKARGASSDKLALQILWATAMVYVVACVGYLWVHWDQTVLYAIPLSVAWVLIMFLIFYWVVPLLILGRRKIAWLHSWHVWGAWVCTTLPLLWELLLHHKEGPLIVFGGNISAPIVAALSGLVLGAILFRLKIGVWFGVKGPASSPERR